MTPWSISGLAGSARAIHCNTTLLAGAVRSTRPRASRQAIVWHGVSCTNICRSTPERWQVLQVLGRSVASSGAIRLLNSASDSATQSTAPVVGSAPVLDVEPAPSPVVELVGAGALEIEPSTAQPIAARADSSRQRARTGARYPSPRAVERLRHEVAGAG